MHGSYIYKSFIHIVPACTFSNSMHLFQFCFITLGSYIPANLVTWFLYIPCNNVTGYLAPGSSHHKMVSSWVLSDIIQILLHINSRLTTLLAWLYCISILVWSPTIFPYPRKWPLNSALSIKLASWPGWHCGYHSWQFERSAPEGEGRRCKEDMGYSPSCNSQDGGKCHCKIL